MKKKLLATAFLLLLGYGVVLYLVPLFFPLPERLAAAPEQGTVFTDRNGKPIRRLLAGDLKVDEAVTFEEIPESLLRATLAAEDSRFFAHNGIDYPGILRAVRDGIRNGGVVSGASTISQQVIKLASPPRERNLETKAIEMLTARKLEIFYSKEEIVTSYINHLPYGNQFTGARAAARGYFGKPLADLSVAEAAMLAGLPNKPSRLNPWSNREGARLRQQWVLGRMKEEGWISEAEFAAALVEELRFQPKGASAFHAPHFVDLILQEDPEAVKGKETVQTTLDLGVQRIMESAITSGLAGLRARADEESDLQAAAVVIENSTGNVLALAGSRSFFLSDAGQVNGAWAPRSAGSTLKPFTYLLAFDRGYNAASVLADTPIEYVTSSGAYQPVNFDRRFRGPVTVRRALANSLNVPAVKLLSALGGPEILHELLQDDLGFTTLPKDPSEYGLGLTLGNAEVRLLELTNAYACLARLGEYRPWKLVRETGDGTGAATGDFRTVLFDRANAWILADILSDDHARVESFGLNSPLRLPFRVAAKTGTSTDFRDNWTVGYTPDYTVGVWVGRFNNRPLNKLSGALGAGPIFQKVMLQLYGEGKTKPRWYPEPATLVRATVNPLNGKRLEEGDRRGIREYFTPFAFPVSSTQEDFSPGGKTKLSLVYASWWESESNQLKDRAVLEFIPDAESVEPFRIVSPLDGTRAFLDPDLPNDGKRFPLRVAGSGHQDIRWSSDSLQIETRNGRNWLVLQPGEHKVIAEDRDTGEKSVARVMVERL